MIASLLTFLTALMRTLPALESLVRQAIAERDKDREREAAVRLQAKDAAVDAAIPYQENKYERTGAPFDEPLR